MKKFTLVLSVMFIWGCSQANDQADIKEQAKQKVVAEVKEQATTVVAEVKDQAKAVVEEQTKNLHLQSPTLPAVLKIDGLQYPKCRQVYYRSVCSQERSLPLAQCGAQIPQASCTIVM